MTGPAARPLAVADRDRRAARSAGAIGLALFASGVNVVLAMLAVGLLLLVLRAFVLDLFGTLPGEAGADVRAWVDGIDATPIAVGAVLGVLLAVGLGAAGVMLSMRILRAAGIEPADRITWRGCVLGTLLQLGLGAVSSWMLGLLWLLAGLLAPWLIVLISVLLSTTASALIGYFAGPGLWRRQVRRARALHAT